jgi:hypothetical protein
VSFPKYDGIDPGAYPGVRQAIIRWITLTSTPLEEQAETLMTGMSGMAALALQGYEPGDLFGFEGIEVMLATLDDLCWEEADSDLYEKYEDALFAEPRKARESLMAYTLRLHAAHAALLKKRPMSMDDGMRGYLLMRGAGLHKGQRDQTMMKTNFDFSWQSVAPLPKRISEDKGGGNQASAFVAAAVVSRGDHEEESAASAGVLDLDEGEDIEGDVVQAAIAAAIDAALGDFDMEEIGDGPPDFHDDGRSMLSPAECVTCSAAIVTEEPRRWDEARELINEKNRNRIFRTPREKRGAAG